MVAVGASGGNLEECGGPRFHVGDIGRGEVGVEAVEPRERPDVALHVGVLSSVCFLGQLEEGGGVKHGGSFWPCRGRC